MTYRERRERKAERLRGWADKRDDKGDALRKEGDHLRGDWAFATQPGHIPERARMVRRDDRAYEHHNKAAAMRSRADGIEHAADRAIYSDDPDAVQQLEARIGALEAERARCKYINTQIRKGDGWEARIDPPLTDKEQRELVSIAKFSPAYAAENIGPGMRRPFKGYPSYHFSNLSGNLGRQKKRLAVLRAEDAAEVPA